ncbi:hypothetical protein [Archaeoglobus fulgidus]|jgi:hypothetical protein|nr:hypothetical protein [Archaeoglobus fulgidus]AIG97895.1 hypothetical protein AFULGI_00011120 [Archaeoglobus fulgidus DSM 8774]KUJ92727.1 MAG: hypothetical protein XD40_2071 [Archaeoglobus fulgidus]KUK05809.1 MAG: Uncharacterized protein XD48_1948 [Archaeoglobus fulgidus]
MDARRLEDEVEMPLEGIVYGEVSGWLTIIGILVAIAGIIIGVVTGNSVFDYQSTIKDLLSGHDEEKIWTDDSIFHSEPHGYWFLNVIHTGDGIAMFGIALAVYGGIVGLLLLIVFTFRSREVLLYKKGLYTFLAIAIFCLMVYCAWEAEF